MRRNTGRLAVVVLLGGLVLGAAVRATGSGATSVPRVWPVLGSEFPIGLSGSLGPAVAARPNSEYLVAWEDTFMWPNWGDVLAQRVAASGALVGVQVPVAVGNPNATQPQVTYNSRAGHYLVVWIDTRVAGAPAVYGLRVSAAGAPVGSDFQISGPDAVMTVYDTPAVAYNSATNQYLVVWTDLRNNFERGHDIYGRRVSATGTPLGDDILISGPSATEDDDYPAVAYSPVANQFLVMWSDRRDFYERGDDIYGRRVRAFGAVAKNDFRVSGSSATAGEGLPAIAYNSDADEYLVVWVDRRNGLRDIYGQRVPSVGAKIGRNFRISRGPDNESSPSAAYSPDSGQYLVVWDDGRNTPTRGSDIFGRRVDADGTLLDRDFRICALADKGNDMNPDVAYGDGEYLVAWAGYRSDWKIFGVRVDAAASG